MEPVYKITIITDIDSNSLHAAVLSQLIRRICADFQRGDTDNGIPSASITLVEEAIQHIEMHDGAELADYFENSEVEENDDSNDFDPGTSGSSNN